MAFLPTANTAILAANASGATTVVTTNGGSGFLVTNTSGNIVLVNIGAAATLPAVNVTTTIAASNAVANGNTSILTVTFSDPGSVPYAANSYIALTGFTPNTYNTTSAQVITGSNTTITVSTSGTGNVTVLGNVSQTINNSTDVVPVGANSSMVIGASPVTNAPGNITIGAITLSGTANIYITPGM